MFYMKRNLPGWERALRLLLALLVAAAALYGVPSDAMTVLAFVGAAILGGTAIVGFCPACALFGRESLRTPQ